MCHSSRVAIHLGTLPVTGGYGLLPVSKDSVVCSQTNLLQVCYCVLLSRKPIFLVRLLCRPKQMKNPIHLPWNYRYPNRLLGALWGWMPRHLAQLWYIFIWVIWLFVYQRPFYAKFPVFVKSVFKIVTRALPLRPTPNHPATSKLRDRRRICLFFRAKGELRERARRESNKLTGAIKFCKQNTAMLIVLREN